MSTRFSLLAAAIVLVALALTPSAMGGGGFGVTPAAQPFSVGTGEFPDMAVDAAGTAHVVWNQDSGSSGTTDPIHYCRVPRGATACSAETVLSAPLDTTGRTTYVFAPSAGRVIVESFRCCGDDAVEGNYVFESTDGGQTFGAARRIGNIDHQQDAAFGPGEAISGARADASRTSYQRMPVAGPAPAGQTEFASTGLTIPTHAAVGIFGGSTPVQVFSDGDAETFVRLKSGDPNVAANWTPPASITPPGGEPRMAGGPAGLVLLDREGEPGARTLVARRFDGTSFGAGAGVTEVGDPIWGDLSAEPGSGAFLAAWVANAESPNELRWRSSADGASWGTQQVALAGDAVDAIAHLQAAAAPDGEGFAVWDEGGNNSKISVIPLKEAAPSGGGGGGGGTDGSATNPSDSVTVGGQQLTLLTPAACVNPGVKITMRVTSKTKQQLSPKKRVKIVYVVFSLDKKKTKDKKAAFKATFKTAGFAPGSTHKLRAKVRLKPVVGKGKKKTKTLKGKLTICG
jgi:hypothetical protein